MNLGGVWDTGLCFRTVKRSIIYPLLAKIWHPWEKTPQDSGRKISSRKRSRLVIFLKAAFEGETISLGSKTCLKLPHDEAFCYLPEGHFIIWTSSLRLHFLPSLKLGWEGHSAQMSLCGLKGKRPLIPLHVHKVSPPVPGGKHHWGFHCLLQCPEFPEVTWSDSNFNANF